MDLPAIPSFDGLVSIWPVDWILIGALVAFIAFDSFRSGGNRAASLALSLPIVILLQSALLKAAFLGGFVGQFSTPILESIMFGALFVGMYIFASRIIGSWGAPTSGVIESLLTGIGATVILLVVWLSTPSLDSIWHFSPQVQYIFSESYRFWWLLASYAALAFAKS